MFKSLLAACFRVLTKERSRSTVLIFTGGCSMTNYIRQMSAPLALTLALVAGACSTDKKDDTLATDSALNRDLQMANRDTAAQPTLSDVPAATNTPTPTTKAPTTTRRTTTGTSSGSSRTTTPARTTPSNAPTTTASGNTVSSGTKGSEGSVGTIAAGTTLTMTSGQRVCTNTNKVGDRFTATISEAVMGANGAMIPAGATAVVQVTELKRSENANDKAVLGLRVVSISSGGRSYPIDAQTTDVAVDRVRNQPKSKDVQKVVGGAVIGAVIGQA